MKTKIIIIGLAAMLAAGCLTSASRINNVALDMNQAQVVKIMGEPSSIIRGTNSVCLNYNLGEVLTDFNQPGTPYEIKLVDDKVTWYGRTGDAPGHPTSVPMVMPVVR